MNKVNLDMATFTKRGTSWQARVRNKFLKDCSKSKSFSKKALAEKWARELELGIFIDIKKAQSTLMADLF